MGTRPRIEPELPSGPDYNHEDFSWDAPAPVGPDLTSPGVGRPNQWPRPAIRPDDTLEVLPQNLDGLGAQPQRTPVYNNTPDINSASPQPDPQGRQFNASGWGEVGTPQVELPPLSPPGPGPEPIAPEGAHVAPFAQPTSWPPRQDEPIARPSPATPPPLNPSGGRERVEIRDSGEHGASGGTWESEQEERVALELKAWRRGMIQQVAIVMVLFTMASGLGAVMALSSGVEGQRVGAEE